MVFGEIVEPSTRALIDDEFCEQSRSLEWDQDVQPDNIDTLLISETKFANKILEVCLLDNRKPVCSTLYNEISIYKRQNNCVILCNILDGVSIGEVLENIIPWVNKSQNIYTLTTAPVATFQNKNSSNDLAENSMRELSTNNVNFYPRLEVPNLITGVSAGVQTYCIHTNRNCTLFVNYTECEPIDSVNSKPVLDLLRKVNMKPSKEYQLREKVPMNNLYM